MPAGEPWPWCSFWSGPLCPEEPLKVMPAGYEGTGRPCSLAGVQCGVKAWTADVHWGSGLEDHRGRSHLETANGSSCDKLVLDFKNRLQKGAGGARWGVKKI